MAFLTRLYHAECLHTIGIPQVCSLVFPCIPMVPFTEIPFASPRPCRFLDLSRNLPLTAYQALSPESGPWPFVDLSSAFCYNLSVMAGKKPNRKQKQKSSPSAPLATAPGPRMDHLALMPGVLLCLLTLLILLMDLLIPGMGREQYRDYPALFRMTHALILACGVLFWILVLRQRGLTWLAPANLFRRDHLYPLFFVLFCVWILLSTAVNGLDEKAIHGVSYRNLGVFHLLSLFLVYMFLSSQIRRRDLRRGLLALFLGISDLMGLAVLGDRYLWDTPAFALKKEISAIFFNGNHYGYFLTMAILIAAGFFLLQTGRPLRIFGLASLLLNAGILLLNTSFGCLCAVIAVLLSLLLLLLLVNRRAAARLAILLAVLSAFCFLGLAIFDSLRSGFFEVLEDLQQIRADHNDAGSAGHNRWLLWMTAIDLISQRPVFGYGCEGISHILMTETGRGNPHCEPLHYAASFGLPAALFYLLGLLDILRVWIQRKIWSFPEVTAAALAALGYFISSLFGVPMFYTAPFFFIFLGMSLSQDAR